MDRQARAGYNVKNPKGREILIGTMLFLSCLILYCFQTFLIKIMLSKFNFSVSEFTYLLSFPQIMLIFYYHKWAAPDKDFMDIQKEDLWPLLLRCTYGFLTDVALYIAFTYTSYSKAFCVGKCETLYSPFIAMYLLGESVKIADIVGILFGFVGMLMLL